MVGTRHRIRGCGRDGRAYDVLVPDPIADLAVDLRLEAVEADLRALDVLARTTVGAKPIVRSLLATESLSSRQIMALAAGRTAATGPDAHRRMLRFEQACHDGRRGHALDVAVLQRIHRRLVPGGGRMRADTVWVGGVASPADAVYVPPPPGEIDRLLTDLVGFLARDDLCPVVQAVIGYAQLEFIHPFRDGNGRLGRWLVQVVPRRRGVATVIVPPVGLWFAANPASFLPAHRAYRDGDVEAWCTVAGQALQECAAAAAALIRDEAGGEQERWSKASW